MIRQSFFAKLLRRGERKFSTYQHQNNWLTRLLAAIAARVRFALKKEHGIVAVIDDVSVYSGRIGVSGWALTGKGADDIRAIDVSVNGVVVGQAAHGDARGDVEQAFPFIRKSGSSGFHFYGTLPKNVDALNAVVQLRITRNNGRSRRITRSSNNQYALWIQQNEPNADALEQQRRAHFPFEPRISLITPTYNTPERFLIEMIESVRNQTYSNWELCIADGASREPHVKEILTRYAAQDQRIKVALLPENKGIAGNSNAAASLATGEFVGLLDHDDTLPPFALFELVRAIQAHQDCDYFYSDEDHLSEDGTIRHEPYFKPDFSPDTLRSTNYPTHFSVFRKTLFDQLGGFRAGFDGSQDYDLILRATERAKGIAHIPKILYHWRMHDQSVARNSASKTYAYDAGQRAIAEHLERIGLVGRVEQTEQAGYYKVTYNLTAMPLISIIIPNCDHADDLRRCVHSIVKKSSYQQIEIIIAENGSRERETFALYEQFQTRQNIRILEWKQAFNYAAVNNFAAEQARGGVLLFLNNDTEVINPDWLERMLEHALRPDIGAVGAKLYYPDETIQHAGIIVGICGVAGHGHKHFPARAFGYHGRLQMIQNVSAVTGACLMLRAALFREMRGFDESFELIAYHDIDFCLKLRQQGFLIVWTPYAELYHYESKTRGDEDSPKKQARFQLEYAAFQRKWERVLHGGDPYYNPNLTKEREDFSLHLA